jgi:hypothetical protein
MTAHVCGHVRRAAKGEYSAGSSADRIDDGDAALVERAWKTLAPKQRELLRWHYIRNARPSLICRRLGIPHRPTSVFDIELAQAEAAIGIALSSPGNATCTPRS